MEPMSHLEIDQIPYVITPTPSKMCNICKRDRFLGFFGYSSRTHDKVQTRCKECINTYHAEYRGSCLDYREKARVASRNYRSRIAAQILIT